jgi:hypothetical protein
VMGHFDHEDHVPREDREGQLQYYNTTTHALTDTDRATQIKENITDPWGLVYDDDERLAVYYNEQSGKHIPLNPRYVRHAVTWYEVNGGSGESQDCNIAHTDYPRREDSPNVYPIKFVKYSYTEEAGQQSATLEYLNASSCPDAYVLNIAASDDGTYLPVFSPLTVYNCVGRNGQPQWYTNTCCTTDESSSSSSASSGSSESSQGSSLSSSLSSRGSSLSSSLSSGGSSLSSSLSSSGGSSDSSSGDSSASSGGSSASSQDFSSGGSSASSGGSSDSSSFECADFVSSLSFDSGTCILTYCLKTLCWPKTLGITVSGESC